jgi:hypothetical protein
VQEQLERLDQAISLLRNLSNGSRPARGGRRNMSASARKRIAAAQKARWAKWHQQHGQTIRKLLRNVLSRLHPGARWRLLRGRGGLTGRTRRSSIPVLRPAVLFYKPKLSPVKTESPFIIRLCLRATADSHRVFSTHQHSTAATRKSAALVPPIVAYTRCIVAPVNRRTLLKALAACSEKPLAGRLCGEEGTSIPDLSTC